MPRNAVAALRNAAPRSGDQGPTGTHDANRHRARMARAGRVQGADEDVGELPPRINQGCHVIRLEFIAVILLGLQAGLVIFVFLSEHGQ